MLSKPQAALGVEVCPSRCFVVVAAMQWHPKGTTAADPLSLFLHNVLRVRIPAEQSPLPDRKCPLIKKKIHAVQVKMHLTFQGLRKEYLLLESGG